MIEKKLTLAVIAAIAAQTGGVLMWAGAASERLKAVEEDLEDHASAIERLTRVEVRLEMAGAQLARIEHKLDGTQ